MLSLNNKKIILAVSGGIAAYKSALLLRLLIKQGARVQVVMTESAKEFVAPLTFQALSGEIVRSDLFDSAAEAGMGHIELAQWADLMIIAPATANTLAKITHGLADNLLTALCLTSKAPLLIAPAMNQQMWNNTTTQENVTKLSKKQSIFLCGPALGEQACGDSGYGRMEEPQKILQQGIKILENQTISSGLLKDRHILITAGPTIEDIDPVRYVTNRSSGKMGYAIAQAAINEGARVSLVSGPVCIEQPQKVEFYSIRSARQMHETVLKIVASADVFIATAAVADYRPASKRIQKLKKNSENLTIELIKNPDILADVAALANKPVTIGFAAETNDIEAYAIDKLKRKNLDMIAANQVGDAKGFEKDDNELYLFWHKDNEIQSKKLPLADKQILAKQLIEEIALSFTQDINIL
ncbi:MAG: bifunctional phosphopantothenoylcysteine decarboxylase/phosphopantothenate--cysteine ligase CoaBC [gamma proteobacterium symbiont of Taylorina sp.]|nr:bifunctional phosphopantothenoylcysteine decarboxylase/phosphopantothenate--cysteine ligase CoaBC [gamma proteobacterium symbiont of Taylorina sp.]